MAMDNNQSNTNEEEEEEEEEVYDDVEEEMLEEEEDYDDDDDINNNDVRRDEPPRHGTRDPSVTEEERLLLQPLAKWFRGVSFEGANLIDVRRNYMHHYSEFIHYYMIRGGGCEWPEYIKPTAADGGGAAAADASRLICQICRHDTHGFRQVVKNGGSSLLEREPPQSTTASGATQPEEAILDMASTLVQCPGTCHLEKWNKECSSSSAAAADDDKPAPHVAHRECYLTGYLDAMLIRSGMIHSMEHVRMQPTCINKRKLLDLFDVVPYQGENKKEQNDSGNDKDNKQQQDVVLRIKSQNIKECLFCASLGLNNASLQQMRQWGFRVFDHSPQTVLGLLQTGAFWPLPVHGTVRPCFATTHAVTLLRHAVPGTFVDFDGYRCTHLCVVVDDDIDTCAIADGHNAPVVRHFRPLEEYDDEDEKEKRQTIQDQRTARATVHGKRYLRLTADEAGYAVVPRGVVRHYGLLTLTEWPQELQTTLRWLCLPGTDHELFTPEEGNNIMYCKEDDEEDDDLPHLTPVLQSDEDLCRSLDRYQTWLGSTLPMPPQESPLRNHNHTEQQQEQQRNLLKRQWRTQQIEELKCIVTFLKTGRNLRRLYASSRRRVSDTSMPPVSGKGLSLQELCDHWGKLQCFLQAPHDVSFRRLWGNHLSTDGPCDAEPPLEWKHQTIKAFSTFLESRLDQAGLIPKTNVETTDLRLAQVEDRSEWPPLPQEDEMFRIMYLTSAWIRNPAVGRDGWARKVPIVPAEHCRRVGYSTFIHLVAIMGGCFALELDSAPYACSKYLVVYKMRVPHEPHDSGLARISHNATLTPEDQKHLERLEAVCLETVRAAQARMDQEDDDEEEEEDHKANDDYFDEFDKFAEFIMEEFKTRGAEFIVTQQESPPSSRRPDDHQDTPLFRIPNCSTCGDVVTVPTTMAVNTVLRANKHLRGYGKYSQLFSHTPTVIEGKDYEGLDDDKEGEAKE